jgi:hypothetical protein
MVDPFQQPNINRVIPVQQPRPVVIRYTELTPTDPVYYYSLGWGLGLGIVDTCAQTPSSPKDNNSQDQSQYCGDNSTPKASG